MTDIRQNFSLMAGDDTYVNYGIVPPPVPPIDLTQADMTWVAYPQLRGVADKTQQVVSKTRSGGGIEITDPANYQYTVDLDSADTMQLAGNYYYEIVVIDPSNQNRRSTPTIGTMTVVDTSDPLNVVALKSMFPSLQGVEDAILQTALDEAAIYVDENIWTDDAVLATFYLAGHFVSASQMNAESGGRTVTSESIGQISVSYAAGETSGGTGSTYPSLSTTSFGLMFLALQNRNSGGIAIA